jgi:hypothetical protein
LYVPPSINFGATSFDPLHERTMMDESKMKKNLCMMSKLKFEDRGYSANPFSGLLKKHSPANNKKITAIN